jgi:hypothetical protein
LLTEGTAFNIFTDIGTEARPPEVMLDEFFCLETARVAHGRVIMEPAEEIVPSRRGDIGMVLVV